MKYTKADLADKFRVYPLGHWSVITVLHMRTPFQPSEISWQQFQSKLSEKTHHGKSYGQFSDAFKLICTLFCPIKPTDI